MADTIYIYHHQRLALKEFEDFIHDGGARTPRCWHIHVVLSHWPASPLPTISSPEGKRDGHFHVSDGERHGDEESVGFYSDDYVTDGYVGPRSTRSFVHVIRHRPLTVPRRSQDDVTLIYYLPPSLHVPAHATSPTGSYPVFWSPPYYVRTGPRSWGEFVVSTLQSFMHELGNRRNLLHRPTIKMNLTTDIIIKFIKANLQSYS